MNQTILTLVSHFHLDDLHLSESITLCSLGQEPSLEFWLTTIQRFGEAQLQGLLVSSWLLAVNTALCVEQFGTLYG